MKRILPAQSLLGLLLIGLPLLAQAEVPQWQIIPEQSTLSFVASQNSAPIKGQFKSFDGTIAFDPEQLDQSKVTINVDMNSVSTAFQDASDLLKTEDFFSIKVFPEAVFKADNFTQTKDGYEAKGTLSIRKTEIPVVLNFKLDHYSGTEAEVEGSTVIKRNQFGIGQGDWASTDEIKDEVKVEFHLKAKSE